MKEVKGSNRKHKSWPVALGIALLAALTFASVVSAAEPAIQQVSDATIENFLKREQIALTNQGQRLDNANAIIAKVPAWIDALKAKGKDTSALESAFSAYQSAVTSAQSDHDQAAGIIGGAAGFDASGKITDRKTALQTVRDGARALRQAHLTLTQGTLDFRIALQDWRAANQGGN